MIEAAEEGSAESLGNFNVFTNFKHYTGLSLPDIVVQDITATAFTCRPVLDAIICDPPYGVKVSSRTNSNPSNDARKGKFVMSAVYSHLIDLARKTLSPGRRIVFFYHTGSKKTETSADEEFLDSMRD